MPLATTAWADFQAIINDEESGGIPFYITSPAGVRERFLALSTLISLSMDPGTGESVSGLQSTASVPIANLITAGFYDAATGEGIHGVPDGGETPWVCDFDDDNGRHWNMKVTETNPDYSLGNMLLMLELYESV